MNEFIFKSSVGFEWDKGNRDKNWDKHGVSTWECEQVFFNTPFLLYEDTLHSNLEPRWYALGKTNGGRRLFVVFTVRKKLIRIISARDASKKEKFAYENA